ncbi:MAG: sigma-54 dependent transcriptional regulator, partial [Verrucomicrobia bacterium]|nr:sigma-54 dependent transcriptional regulator [Verrucomicrobiota bacterium]
MCSAGPFVPVNCSAIPADLAESTLFGHKKGSFTGATKDHKGAFDTADGGTLFLDEIGDMPADMQAKLLRVLEDSTVTPVGCSVGHSVNVRIVAATNADLMIKIEKREFRSDLYYRIAAYTIQIPPLRERKSDIPTLARHFAQELAADMGFAPPGIDSKALSLLKDQPFPGNVRELRNVIEGALIRGRGGPIRAEHLITIHRTTNPKALAENEALRPSGAPAGLPLNLNEVEAIAIKRAMAVAHGNVSAAARLLGINRSKLHRKLAALYTP